LEEIVELIGKVSIIMKMFRLLVLFFFVGHVCACILFLVESDSDYDPSMYLTALSWSLMTISTIGSSSLEFNTSSEQIYLIGVAAVSLCLLMYLLTEITQIVC
jgi:hypothetical protein